MPKITVKTVTVFHYDRNKELVQSSFGGTNLHCDFTDDMLIVANFTIYERGTAVTTRGRAWFAPDQWTHAIETNDEVDAKVNDVT